MRANVSAGFAVREVPLTVRARGLVVDKKLRRGVQRILTSALGRLAFSIQTVHVWLEDVNGPRGGADTRCRIDIHLRRGGRMSVSAVTADEYAATARAAARARELIDRRIKKTRARRRQTVRI